MERQSTRSIVVVALTVVVGSLWTLSAYGGECTAFERLRKLGAGERTPRVHGRSAVDELERPSSDGSPYLTASGPSRSGGTWWFVLDGEKRRLVTYSAAGGKLAERAARNVSWDDASEEFLSRGASSTPEALEREFKATHDPARTRRYRMVAGASLAGSTIVFVFEASGERLLAYSMASGRLRYRGCRRVSFDLASEELLPSGARLSVASVKKTVKNQAAPASPSYELVAGPTTHGGSVLYLLSPETRRIASYTVDTAGIRFLGVRAIEWDLAVESIEKRKSRVHVRDMKARVREAPKDVDLSLELARTTDGDSRLYVWDSRHARVAVYRTDPIGIDLIGVRTLTVPGD